MDSGKMGRFISELRKSNKMTQKDLAEKLNISDKAVSKWERGLNCPDISLLSSLADILGVTTSELLNSEKSSTEVPASIAASVDNALQYADQTAKNKFKSIQRICAAAISALFLLGILTCSICNVAISGTFSWSLYPISSIIFTWLVLFPTIMFGEKGIAASLISLSVFTIPFLYVLNSLNKAGDMIMSIGIRMSAISIPLLWIVFILFKILKPRKLIATGISLLLAIPANILINVVLSKIIAEPLIDIWDIMTFSIIIVAAITLFVIDHIMQKKRV